MRKLPFSSILLGDNEGRGMAKQQTATTKRFNIRHPILLAPMAYCFDGLLDAAVILAVFCLFNVGRPAFSSVPYEPAEASNGTSAVIEISALKIPTTHLAQRGERRRPRSSGSSERKEGSRGEANYGHCTECEELEGFVPPNEISNKIRMMVGKARRDRERAVAIQKARGGIETGLEPNFIDGADCPEIDSESWAIDYSHKRPWPAIHKGVDIPQPRGTPIRAISAGTIVGKFSNEGNRKGVEIMLRHTPGQTGLPFWTYSQYTHLREMSPLAIGASVEMGQEIGKTSNTGKMGRRIRRDALHFAILYSEESEWSNDGSVVIPKESFWMDPHAFYRSVPPYESRALAALPDDKKSVPIPYMKPDGSLVPPKTNRIWPFSCQ